MRRAVGGVTGKAVMGVDMGAAAEDAAVLAADRWCRER